MVVLRFQGKTNQYGITTIIGIVVMFLLSITSCGRENAEMVEVAFDPETTYTMRTTDVAMLVSDSGVTRYRLNAKEWLTFDKAVEPYYYFPEGIYVEKFDSLFQTEASVKADTAYNWTKKEMWKLIDNVEVQNLQGDRFYTSELYWDQKAGEIYSDKPVLMIDKEGKESYAEGGFKSNQDMTKYQFYNGKSDLGEFKDKPQNQDSIPTPVITENP